MLLHSGAYDAGTHAPSGALATCGCWGQASAPPTFFFSPGIQVLFTFWRVAVTADVAKVTCREEPEPHEDRTCLRRRHRPVPRHHRRTGHRRDPSGRAGWRAGPAAARRHGVRPQGRGDPARPGRTARRRQRSLRPGRPGRAAGRRGHPAPHPLVRGRPGRAVARRQARRCARDRLDRWPGRAGRHPRPQHPRGADLPLAARGRAPAPHRQRRQHAGRARRGRQRGPGPAGASRGPQRRPGHRDQRRRSVRPGQPGRAAIRHQRPAVRRGLRALRPGRPDRPAR